jgi:hypothetical protein
VPTIIEMVMMTLRLHRGLGLADAPGARHHHCLQREYQDGRSRHALMRNDVADLALESEAALLACASRAASTGPRVRARGSSCASRPR